MVNGWLGRRLMGAIAMVIVVGCTSSPEPSAPTATDPVATNPTNASVWPTMPADTAPRPEVGQCRRDGSNGRRHFVFDDRPVVPCDQPHSSETWAVVDLDVRWRQDDLPEGENELAVAFRKELLTLCPEEQLAEHLGVTRTVGADGGPIPMLPVVSEAYAPTPQQWAGGARWVRCEAAVAWEDPEGSLTAPILLDEKPAPDAVGPPPEALSMPTCSRGDDHPERCDRPHVMEIVAWWPSQPKPLNGVWSTTVGQQSRCAELVGERFGAALPDPNQPGPRGVRALVTDDMFEFAPNDAQYCLAVFERLGEPGSMRLTTGSLGELDGRPPTEPPVDGAGASIGQCRRSGAWVVKDVPNDASPTVPCDQPHGLETIRVPTLPEDLRLLPGPPDHGGAAQRFADVAYQACPTALDELAGIESTETDVGRRSEVLALSTHYFIPTAQEWAAGARWLRCDVGVEWDDRTGALTGPLDGIARTPAAARLRRCYTVDVHERTIALPCEQRHVREQVTRYRGVTTPQPDRNREPAVWSQWEARCRDDALRYVGGNEDSWLASHIQVDVVTTGAQWDEPDSQIVACWMGFAKPNGAPQSTVGSARGRGEAAPRIN